MKNRVEHFIKKGMPEEWFDYANELKEAAQTLWKSHSNVVVVYKTEEESYSRKLYSRTYFFLLGVAIENLIKGILISENPEFLKDGKISIEISSGHNLKNLSEKINSLNFDLSERKVLDVLSELIPYWGKYPIPKDFSKIKDEKFFDEFWYEKLMQLYEKLELQIYRLNINGIDGPNGIKFPKLILTHLNLKI